MSAVAELAALIKIAKDAAIVASSTLVAVGELNELMEQNAGADLTPEQLEPFIARRKAAEEDWANRER